MVCMSRLQIRVGECEMTRINELRQRLAFMDEEGNEIDDAEVQANPEKYGLKPPKQDKPFKWNPPRDPEHEAWVQEQYDNFDKAMGTIKAEMAEIDVCPGCKRSRKKCGTACKFHREHSDVDFKGKEPSSWRTRGAKLKTRLARIYES